MVTIQPICKNGDDWGIVCTIIVLPTLVSIKLGGVSSSRINQNQVVYPLI